MHLATRERGVVFAVIAVKDGYSQAASNTHSFPKASRNKGFMRYTVTSHLSLSPHYNLHTL